MMFRLCLVLFALVFSFASAAKSFGSAGRTGGSGGGRYGTGTNTHTYPKSTGYSGNNNQPSGSHTYPSSTGLSGNRNTQTYQVHHHYHYNPPNQINYGSGHHPVYQHPPPMYVYEYRNSGSRFDSLLTGLALYNLGRMSSNSGYGHRDYRSSYGENCKLGISKTNGEYEETRIDCKLMSSFIWDADKEKNRVATVNTVTTTVVNVTHSNLNVSDDSNSTDTEPKETITSTVTIQNTTVVDALQVKGPSVEVTPDMSCFMIRVSRDSSILKRKVDCGLLQAYAVNSLHYNKAEGLSSLLTFATLPFLVYILN